MSLLDGFASVSRKALLSLVFSAALTAAAPPPDFQLYAYGRGLYSGFRVFAAQGRAYIGNLVPENVSWATNVTFHTTGLEGQPWYVTPDGVQGAGETVSPDSVLFLESPNANSRSMLGVAQNGSLPEGAQDGGFRWYGESVFWLNSTGNQLQAKFWAEPMRIIDNKHGLWALHWNYDNLIRDNSVPVTLKPRSPVEQTATA